VFGVNYFFHGQDLLPIVADHERHFSPFLSYLFVTLSHEIERLNPVIANLPSVIAQAIHPRAITEGRLTVFELECDTDALSVSCRFHKLK
jgi:hypothetical protein